MSPRGCWAQQADESEPSRVRADETGDRMGPVQLRPLHSRRKANRSWLRSKAGSASMKNVILGAFLCIAFFAAWPSTADSVSLPGYSVVRLDAATGEILWRFGENLINPLLEVERGSLMVSAETTDHVYHTWEIDPHTGVLKQELQSRPPSQLGLRALERFSCDSNLHLDTLAGLWKPPVKGRSGRGAGWLGASRGCVVAELGDEIGWLFGVDPNNGKTLWTQDLRPRLPYKPGRTRVWPLLEGGFLAALDPLIFRVTEK